MGWENWINLNVWKFSHLLQTILQRLRRINFNKHGNGHVKDGTASIAVLPPSKFIDCLPSQSHDTEKSTDVPSNPNANESSNIDDMPVEELPSDKPSSDTHTNLMVQQEGKLEYKSNIRSFKFLVLMHNLLIFIQTIFQEMLNQIQIVQVHRKLRKSKKMIKLETPQ